MTSSKLPSNLTIGVPVFNEEQSLPDSYASLVEAIHHLPRNVNVEVVYCLNGCTDGSENLLRNMTIASRRMENMAIIESAPGKMNAQQAILAQRNFKDAPVCFADADITMAPSTLMALYQRLATDPHCQVAYARVEPHYPGQPTPFQDLLLSHYLYRKHQPPRNYIHGRTFMMRDSGLLEHMNDDLGERLEQVRSNSPEYVSFLGLEDGPKIDDIYLSRIIVAKYGLNAIAEVTDAEVAFHPPATFEDYIRVMERTLTEIKRLDVLYPEHAHLQDTTFRRDFDTVSPSFPEGMRRNLLLLRELECVLKKRIEASLIPPSSCQDHEIARQPWVRAGSTKQAFGNGGHTITEESLGFPPPAGKNQIILPPEVPDPTGEQTAHHESPDRDDDSAPRPVH